MRVTQWQETKYMPHSVQSNVHGQEPRSVQHALHRLQPCMVGCITQVDVGHAQGDEGHTSRTSPALDGVHREIIQLHFTLQSSWSAVQPTLG